MTILLAASAVANAAKQPIIWQTGTIISQDLNSSPAGVYAAPIGTARVAVPIYRTSNIVVVDTPKVIFRWSEVGRRPIVLTVNGRVDFYQDGDWFIVLDTKHRKHKFSIIGATSKGH